MKWLNEDCFVDTDVRVHYKFSSTYALRLAFLFFYFSSFCLFGGFYNGCWKFTFIYSYSLFFIIFAVILLSNKQHKKNIFYTCLALSIYYSSVRTRAGIYTRLYYCYRFLID